MAFVEAVKAIETNFGKAPKTGVVLGSGFKGFAEEIKSPKVMAQDQIPGCPRSTVAGHSGSLIRGKLASKELVCVSGRVHGYEGYHANEVVFLLRVLRKWGVENFVLTNASGSLRKNLKPGSLALIKDQINLTAQSPLTGPELYDGPRFLDCSELFDLQWKKKLQESESLPEAVYAGVLGPSFETSAESQMLAVLGADIVGMSTVWEVLALRQLGAKVLGLSVISNYATGVVDEAIAHSEVLKIVELARERSSKALKKAILSAN